MQRCLGLFCEQCRERSAFPRPVSALVLAPLAQLLPRVLRACGDLINRHDGMVYEQLAQQQDNRLNAAGLSERRGDYRAHHASSLRKH